jgi:C4-type Zn-finger protein
MSEDFLSSDQYVEDGGGSCPICRNADLDYDSVDFDGTLIQQKVSCHECGSSWYDAYRLYAYEDLVLGDDAKRVLREREAAHFRGE